MELSWSIFVLEIVNFLVLLWILQHFLYRPIAEVIARRKAGIDKVREDAQALHAEAQQLKQQYENRLADWNAERQQARAVLERELEAQRRAGLEANRSALEQEREKTRVVEASRQAEARRALQETALAQGAQFATRLLEAAAGAETQSGLVELVIAGLSQLSAERVAAIRQSAESGTGDLVVLSALPLLPEQRDRLQQALLSVAGVSTPPRFELREDLLAGVRITLGPWVLGCNLRDELAGMAALRHAQ